MPYKELLSALAIVLTIAAFFPYIQSIGRGKVTPHIFSWIVWATAVTIVSFAQLADGGGVGAWPLLISGVITYYIVFLAYQRRGNITLARIDWFFFIIALLSLPAWYVMSDPFIAVVMLVGIEICAFIPTIRKAYFKPYEEQITFFLLMMIRNICAMIALEHYSATTLLFPAMIVVMCGILVVIMGARRRYVQGKP